jgi:hypothetical protein
MFANMASLNNWRRLRGFSKFVFTGPRSYLTDPSNQIRYLRFQTPLWRSWGH